ncbi:DUF4352 domain-containing protein [Bacillus mycoides]|uniref:DUF4352 domain-containing protein n=1 Tax=Bacillus mycoides TaxID=1405 RepID=UPI003D65EBB7
MKKVKYKILPALCMTSILFASGCTATQEEKKESIEQKGTDTTKESNTEREKEKVIEDTTKESNTEIGEEKVIEDKKMKVTEAKIIKDDKVTEKEQVVQVKFDIKNEGQEDFGIGSGDFYIKDNEGNTYEMYGREDNFGDVIPAGQSLQGNGYYKVAKDAKELIVVYSPKVGQDAENKSVEWKIGNPTK